MHLETVVREVRGRLDGSLPGFVRQAKALKVGDRVVARVVVEVATVGGGDVRLVTEADVPCPRRLVGEGDSLSAVAEWIARHPEALAPRGVRVPRGGGRWVPALHRIPAGFVRQGKATVWADARTVYTPRTIAGPEGMLP